MPASSVDGGESNEDYRKKVVEELADRERQLLAINRKIDEIRFKLEGTMRTRDMRQGNALKISSAESYRAGLRTMLKRKEQERTSAMEAIRRAKERLALLDEEGES